MQLNKELVQDQNLLPIVEKVEAGQRLTMEDGLILYQSNDLLTIGQLANYVNLKRNGNNVYFIENMYINPTNVCEARCKWCGFRRDPNEEGAYTMSEEEILAYVEQRFTPGLREFHIVGGHNHTVPFEYYVNTVRILKNKYPHMTIKAYTAAEIIFFAKISGLTPEEVLKELIKAGLDTLPGGGAEILTEEYRKKMSPDKATAEEWLNVHRLAHNLGLKTHATMLYGSIDTEADRLTHMIRVRELQDETNGYLCFIPLAVQPKKVSASIKMRTSAYDDMKTLAISRLMLDNVPHIKAYWINIGPQLTQMAITFGSSDIHGTLIEERISHAAGALTQSALTRDELVWLIKGAGRQPVERDTFYNTIKEY